MEVEVKVTDLKLFEEKVSEVKLDLEILDTETFNGSLCIIRKDNTPLPFYGLIEASDYEADYGFLLAACEIETHIKVL